MSLDLSSASTVDAKITTVWAISGLLCVGKVLDFQNGRYFARTLGSRLPECDALPTSEYKRSESGMPRHGPR